jgi:hypothetical protein
VPEPREKLETLYEEWGRGDYSRGRFPRPEASGPLFKAWASEPDAGQDLRDILTRRTKPSELMTPQLMARWFAEAPARAS